MSGRRPQRHRGPKGPIGLTGSAGAAGPTSLSSATPFWMEQQDPEDVFPIPGPAGAAGVAGAPGGAGIAGAAGLPGLDGIDGEDAIGPLGWPAFGVTTLTTQVTGALNDYNPGLGKFTVEHWSGVADAAFTGLRGGAAGHIYIFKNTGTKVATFAHQSGASAAGDKYLNQVTSGVTPVAGGGFIAFAHDGTNWNLVAHEQGDWINVTYNAGDFTGGGAQTWGVDPGDVQANKFYLRGRQLSWELVVSTTSVGGTPSTLLLAKYPLGYQSPNTSESYALPGIAVDNGVRSAMFAVGNNSVTQIVFVRLDGASWSGSVNNTTINTLMPNLGIV